MGKTNWLYILGAIAVGYLLLNRTNSQPMFSSTAAATSTSLNTTSRSQVVPNNISQKLGQFVGFLKKN